jgi:hypothetical protein
VVEFSADLVSVGVVQIVEDNKGLPPGVAGRFAVTSGVASIAEVGERGGFVITIVEFPPQAEGLLVVGEGPGMVTEVLVGGAEAQTSGTRVKIAVEVGRATLIL